MTDKDRLVARLNERIAIHAAATDRAAALDKPIVAAVSRAWVEATAACLADVERELEDDDEPTFEEYVEAAVGAYVP